MRSSALANFMRKIEEKNGQPGINVTNVTYSAYFDDSFFRMLYKFGLVFADDMSSIVEEDLKNCIKKHTSHKRKDNELGRVKHNVDSVKVDQKCRFLRTTCVCSFSTIYGP